jgi:ketosteroid isomerase-like protein
VHPNETVIRSFYDAFARRDAESMIACYADDVVFTDPVFPRLRGDEAKAMWRMLCGRARDLAITCGEARADDSHGEARWEARYLFTQTGRRVHNVVHARFELREGRIVRHVDDFDLWRWTRMALGPTGLLLGWSPMVRKRVQDQAAASLEAFVRASP